MITRKNCWSTRPLNGTRWTQPMMQQSCKTDFRRNAADCGEIPLGSGYSIA